MSFNENIKSPAVLYYKGYQIVMPTYMKSDQEFNMALLHELVHIKHGDLTTKLIADIANVLHYFNPVISRLREDIEKWAEVDCDRDTCEIGKEEFDLKDYFNCLMDMKERSQEEPQLKEICGLLEDENLVVFRVNTILELGRDEMKTPLVGYVVTWFILVFLTIGSLKVSSTVYKFWSGLFADYYEETLDTSLLEETTMEMFVGTELVYFDENLLNQEDSFNFTIGPKETWLFDVSEENLNTVYIDVRSIGRYCVAGAIGKDKQVVSIECDAFLAERLVMDQGTIQHIFVQNLEDEPMKIELLVAK